jgi:hypothetical protein
MEMDLCLRMSMNFSALSRSTARLHCTSDPRRTVMLKDAEQTKVIVEVQNVER